jgi:HEAT repeat protein
MSDIFDFEQMKKQRDIQALIDALRSLGRPPSNRLAFNEAVKALGEIGNGSGVSFLVEEILKESISGERQNIAEALRMINDRTTIPAISNSLRSGDETTRLRAIKSLGALGDRAAVPDLVETLKDENRSLRFNAIYALAEICDEAATPALIVALKDKEKSISWAAAEALGEIGDKRAIPALIEALKDQSEPQNASELVRCKAAEALGKIGDKAAVPALVTVLKDKRRVVREKATDALGEIGDEMAVPALAESLRDNEENVSWKAAKALGKIGEAAVSYLVAAQKDDRWEVRHHAYEVLSNRHRQYSQLNLPLIAGKVAVPTLIEALRDVQWSVRCNAAYILGEIGDKRAVKPLYDLLHDNDEAVRVCAKEALKKVEAISSSPITELTEIYCHNCGSVLKEGWAYCSHCGTKVG